MEPTHRNEQVAPPAIERLAQRLDSDASWNDLALSSPQREALRDIATRVRQPARTADSRTRAADTAPATGVSALFAGSDSATITRAAAALANDLGRELYRVDLSQVVSKYIGETEKNLNRLFAAAESAGWVLFFDEADALFGKRTDVKDAHDRYANLEVGYLLERLESYSGLAILATNRKGSLDEAFTRRVRYVVEFPSG